MLIEELPAIISVTLIGIAFFAAFWRDKRCVKIYRAHLDEFTAPNKDSSFFPEESSTNEKA